VIINTKINSLHLTRRRRDMQMKRAIFVFLLVVAALMLTSNLSADLGIWNPAPDLTDDFTVGSTAGPNLGYIRDPDLIAYATGGGFADKISEPRFYSTYPGGWSSDDLGTDYDPDPIAGNPSGDHTVMGIGNLIADLAQTVGLCYIDIAAASPGGPDIFLTHEDYKFRAYIYFLGTNDTANRYQGGLYLRAGSGQPDLFCFGPFHNASADGGGPGFGYRGSAAGTTELNYTSPLTDGRWVLMEVEAVGTFGSVGADVDGDGTINESDPGEYQTNIELDSADNLNGYPSFWCVSGYSATGYSDQSPMLIDDVELWYQPYVPPTPTLPPGFTPVEMNWAVYY
jgi:hypothetical protein